MSKIVADVEDVEDVADVEEGVEGIEDVKLVEDGKDVCDNVSHDSIDEDFKSKSLWE